MTTTEHGMRGRLARRLSPWRTRLARLLPPLATLESPEDARRAATRTKWAAFIIAALAMVAGAFRMYSVYAVGLLFALFAFGRSDFYRGWGKGYEARRQEHRRELGL